MNENDKTIHTKMTDLREEVSQRFPTKKSAIKEIQNILYIMVRLN